ncbi:plasmid pRiA4b ORF-3 family protein [Alkalicoccus urumqiensis]|uniref:Plasmid pRiA4b Orf3-like domain-containing protein n=1 Tax=Alkalicoccus urumqiensis TaxID=1548213 RepID=A0A2P6MJL6_ALKUR|nr:plasmid pRiA4b ORF-3 family protein [Alkalicoccus urumqiensis]PRO66457.1 hypothetical protein C6I21_03715 [Alkalicoccus urumqiensis]
MQETYKHYQLLITLEEIEPAIWRRLHVPANISFHRLHKIIQAAFDWQDYHLYSFEFSDFLIIEPGGDFSFHEVEKAPKKVKVEQVMEQYEECVYEYDFGDGWLHRITLEETFELPVKEVVCTGGERSRPPEDVGGPGGYAYFLSVIRSPEDEDYENMLAWAEKDTNGRKFDPEYFYREKVNRKLKRV